MSVLIARACDSKEIQAAPANTITSNMRLARSCN